jgi:dsRNA-specific ribonuclease
MFEAEVLLSKQISGCGWGHSKQAAEQAAAQAACEELIKSQSD